MDIINDNFIQNKFGYCWYHIDSEKALVYGLYVYRNDRKQGHARNLVEMVISQIKKSGYKGKIFVEVKPQEKSISKKRLKKFYREMGLKVLKKGRKEDGKRKNFNVSHSNK